VINSENSNLVIAGPVKNREGELVQHGATELSIRDLICIWSIDDSLKRFLDTLHQCVVEAFPGRASANSASASG